MFAVCSSWFEIDERKWTYYHHGSHNDWELGAKTTTVPASKVLDSEWYCFLICKIPQWYFWFLLRFTHSIGVLLILFFVCVSLFLFFGNPHLIHAFQDAAVFLAWLRWTCCRWILSVPFSWSFCIEYLIATHLEVCSTFANFFTRLACIFINSKSITTDA